MIPNSRSPNWRKQRCVQKSGKSLWIRSFANEIRSTPESLVSVRRFSVDRSTPFVQIRGATRPNGKSSEFLDRIRVVLSLQERKIFGQVRRKRKARGEKTFFSSDAWDSISDEEKQALGVQATHDGEFWISFDDFFSNFHQLHICHRGPASLATTEKDADTCTWNNLFRVDRSISTKRNEFLLRRRCSPFAGRSIDVERRNVSWRMDARIHGRWLRSTEQRFRSSRIVFLFLEKSFLRFSFA